MKKLLIASAALAMVAGTAQAQSSVTIYGIMDASVSKQSNRNNSNEDQTTLNSKDSSRIGFRGTEDLGGGLRAIFNLEGAIAPGTGVQGSNLYPASTATTTVTITTTISTATGVATSTNTASTSNVAPATKNRTFDRAAIVGVAGSFGQVTIGRQQNTIVDTNAKFDANRAQFVGTNPFILYGAGNSTDTQAYGSNGADALGVYRQDNSVKYQGTFSGLSINAMQALGAQTGNNAKYSSTGFGASYKMKMVEFGASTQSFNDSADTFALKLTAYGASVTPMTGLNVRVQSAKAKKEASSSGTTDKVNSIGVTYAVTPKIDVTVAHYDVSRATVGAADQDYKRNYLVGEYNLSKRTALYASYDRANYKSATSSTFGQRASTGSDTQSLMNVGVSHKF